MYGENYLKEELPLIWLIKNRTPTVLKVTHISLISIIDFSPGGCNSVVEGTPRSSMLFHGIPFSLTF